MINSLVGFLLGCTHRNTTFPITPMRSTKVSGAAHSATYVVCLDCGKEFGYNWSQMRVEKVKTQEAVEAAQIKVPAQSF